MASAAQSLLLTVSSQAVLGKKNAAKVQRALLAVSPWHEAWPEPCECRAWACQWECY